MVRPRTLATRRGLIPETFQWALGGGLGVALAYLMVAVSTLGDVTEDGAVVNLMDTTWPHWAALGLATVLSGAAAQVLTRLAQPPRRERPADQRLAAADVRRGDLAWVLPAATMATSILLVRFYGAPAAAVVGALAVFVAATATVVIHAGLRSEQDSVRAFAAVALSAIIHVGTFYTLMVIYTFKYRSMYSASAVGLATLLLLLQLTDGEEIAWLRRITYALAGGIVVAESTWVLNYWAVSGPIGGAVLLATFYVAAGLILNSARAALNWRVVTEYGFVYATAFLLTAAAATLNR